ncbi:GntR family transcriptional regulator [Lichenihabitans psoromatis]|uniref:GntR family transcriptional regulator n=1 Tax=Lichenihabitans psoromatis TaxID=2528642 RepID=UPI001FDF8EB4|nr:GntR family transcriptional regulator [Lichenihabitans psoromatis]
MNRSGSNVPRDARFDTALMALRQDISTGRFKDRDMLPGERDLSDLLAISRTTLRRVLSTLVEDGVLSHRHGVGTFVRRTPRGVPEPALPTLTSFTEEMRSRGLSPSSRDIGRGIFRATPEEAVMLACSPGDEVIRLTRLRYADDEPIAIDHAAIPRLLLDDPGEIGASLYEAFARVGLKPCRALRRIQAVTVTGREAGRLGVSVGSAALAISTTAYLPDGRCCEFTRSIYRADRYDIASEVRAPISDPKDSKR